METMKKTRQRNSSIELLRIISMFMIIAQHYVFHGGYENEAFLSASPNVTFLKIITMFAYPACTIFMLITGYYMINAEADKGYYRKLIPLIAELYFYSVVILVLDLIFRWTPLSIRDIIKNLLPIFYGNWYFVFYIAFYLFIPYLNKMLVALNQKEYQRLLIICLVLFVFLQTFFGNVYDLNNLDFMFLSYMFGAYYRLYREDFKYDNKWNLVLSLSLALAIILSVVVFDFIGLKTGNMKFIKNDQLFLNWYTILPMFFPFFIFMYFVNIEYSNKFVNVIASAVPGIYLIHDSLLRSVIWQKISPNVDYFTSPYLHSFVKITLVFFVCCVIDLIRQNSAEKLFMRFLNQKSKKAEK